jgi:hypothetical protein
VYYAPCQHTVADSGGCCAACQADASCIGWFFEQLDCSPFGGALSAGVCYAIADTILGYGEDGVAGGSTYPLNAANVQSG